MVLREHWPLSRPLPALEPQWMHRDGERKLDVGLEFDCPRCRDLKNPRPHRLQLWFVATRSSDDMTLGDGHLHLYDHAGNRFEELTVWTERPERDPLIELDHWLGYIEAGLVHDLPRFGAV